MVNEIPSGEGKIDKLFYSLRCSQSDDRGFYHGTITLKEYQVFSCFVVVGTGSAHFAEPFRLRLAGTSRAFTRYSLLSFFVSACQVAMSSQSA